MDDVKRMSQQELKQYVERRSNEYHPVITNDFDQQTGVWAVVQKKGEGPESRREVQLNSGVRPYNSELGRKRPARNAETLAWAREHGYQPREHAELHHDGPFSIKSKGKTEYFKIGPDGERVSYDPKLGNDHHAEMKVLSWAEKNGYEVVAMSPTRGCCEGCQTALKAAFHDRFAAVVPESRQTQAAFNKYRERALFGEPVERVDGNAALKRTAGKLLAGSEKALKIGGRAMEVFDALTTAADVATKLKDGKTHEAAHSLGEFGGRTAGAMLGAEGGAELGALAGSVVPGPGTVVGAAGGSLLGAMVGAAVGEEGAKRFMQQVDRLGPHPSKADSGPPADARLTDGATRQFSDPRVRTLQDYMYENGYSSPQVNFVCSAVDARLSASDPAATVVDAFVAIANQVAGGPSAAPGRPAHQREHDRLPPKQRPHGSVADWPLVGPRG